jgi:predicted Rossmann-fold nucleotide-binding protein
VGLELRLRNRHPGRAVTGEAVSEVRFSNGNSARLVQGDGASAAALDAALSMPDRQGLITVAGGAAELDDQLKPRLAELFGRGIAQAAEAANAAILDGGTASGVMALVGKGVAERGHRVPLVGVAPADKVAYPGRALPAEAEDGESLDENHSHFVLAPGRTWGDELATRCMLAEALARDRPAVTVLANGGDVAKHEVLHSVRQGWPVIVVGGSGRLADEIAALAGERGEDIDDPELEEIVTGGELHVFPIEGPAEDLAAVVSGGLRPTLKHAWEEFARLDANANRQQGSFKRLQLWILALGVLGTALALTQTQIGDGSGAADILRYAIIVVPITVAALLAAANRFNAGNRWVLLRASAEAIKREIFRYRAQSGRYGGGIDAKTPDAALAARVAAIRRELLQTEVNLAGLVPYRGPLPPPSATEPGDDGLSRLTGQRYLSVRLNDQLRFFERNAARLDRQLRRIQSGAYTLGGAGTLLAAIGFELWVALTTAAITALTTFLGSQQIENTLMKYNQTAAGLAGVRDWWTALSPAARSRQESVDSLVESTETILAGEQAGWVQHMSEALADLKAQLPPEAEKRGPADLPTR